MQRFFARTHVDTKKYLVDQAAQLVFGSDVNSLSAARVLASTRLARVNPNSREMEIGFADACGVIRDASIGSIFEEVLSCPTDATNRLLRNANGQLSLRDAFDVLHGGVFVLKGLSPLLIIGAVQNGCAVL